jgi:hypothetical protein
MPLPCDAKQKRTRGRRNFYFGHRVCSSTRACHHHRSQIPILFDSVHLVDVFTELEPVESS